MYKKIKECADRLCSVLSLKFFLIMKLVFVLLLASFMHVHATSFAQKISINKKDVSLIDVLKEIRKQSGYNILFTARAVKNQQISSIKLTNASIDVAMTKCLGEHGLTYKVIDKNIVISKIKIPHSNSIQQKAISVTGKITDIKGESLPGVSVRLKGSSVGVVSNLEGNYRIEVPSINSILTFSYLGFETLEKKVTNGGVINIVLKEQSESLNQVVVIGYGEVKRSDLTGAVAIVDIEDLQKAPVPTFDQALAGRIAGVQVTGNDGQPGSVNNITIRGNNSLTQDNSPLYVIDGFPVEEFNESPVSPSDIESIQVLKDASATSIYGSRGANGVIIITTKKGAKSAPVISFNTYYGVQNVTNKLDVLSPYEFVKYQNELNPIATARLYFDGRTLEDYKNIEGVDMQDALYRTAPIVNTDLAYRGGDQNTQYSVFVNNINSEGVVLNSGYKRTQGKITLSQKLKKNIKSYINASYTKSTTSGSIVSDPTGGIPSMSLIYSALGYRPIAGFDNIDLLDEFFDPAVITETPTDYRVNPIISVNNEINQRVLRSGSVNGYVDFKLSNKLTFKVRGGMISSDYTTSSFYNSKTQIGSPNYPTSKGSTGAVYTRKFENWLNENTLIYNNKIRKHKFNAVAGFTLQESKVSFSGYKSSFIEDEDLGIDGIDLSTSLDPSTYHKEWSLASFLARANYDYDGKYLFTFSFRTDGSSKFRDANKWGYFPAGAFAWRMKNESFMKNMRAISDAKLRVSYGTTGNNRVDEYATYSGITFPFPSYYSFNNSTPSKGASLLTSTGVPDLKWETTAQFNLGYDLNLFRNRLRFVFDYYNKKTTDLLLNARLPYTTGYLYSYQNIGSVRNSGLEFSLQSNNINKKNFKWTSSFNISFNRNKVLKLQKDQDYRLETVSFVGDFTNVAPYIATVGQPMGVIYGAVFDRLYQYSDFNKLANGTYLLKDEVPINGRARNTIQPGDMKFSDLNNDGTINTSDYTIIGDGNPIHVGGFSNEFQYKNFDLNIFMQWSYGNDILNGNKLYFEQNTYNLYNFNMYASVVNRWTPDNQDTTIPRVGGVPPRIYHTNIVEDGSYLRLKTVSLGYTFSSKLLKPISVKKARVFMSAQNLYTLTNYSGSDPEVSVKNSALTPGFDWSAYPRSRTITIGLNASF